MSGYQFLTMLVASMVFINTLDAFNETSTPFQTPSPTSNTTNKILPSKSSAKKENATSLGPLKPTLSRNGILPINQTTEESKETKTSQNRNQSSSDPPKIKPMNSMFKILNLSKECEKTISVLFGPILNSGNKSFTSKSIAVGELLKLPAGRLIDSWGKIPSRVLDGEMVWLGAYDECQKIPDTKYCLVDTKIMKKYDGKYGICMPSQCSSDDVGKVQPIFGEIVLQTKGIVEFTSTVLCEKETEYTAGFYATVFVFGITLLLILIGTVLELLNPRKPGERIKKRSTVSDQIALSTMTSSLSQNGHVNTEETTEFLNGVNNNDDKEEMAHRKETRRKKKPMLYEVLVCFSLVRNVTAILSTRVPKGAIQCINGIRAISMFWVILGHVFAFGALANMHDTLFLTIETLLRRYSFQIIANAYFSVDTFFVLSGLLVAYLSLRKMDKCGGKLNLLMYYVHRIIRITPPYLYVILFWNNIFRYTLRGPMAEIKRQTFGDDGQCNKYWWTNLVYVNNFYPKQINKECLGWSWYLANDMQFYIIAPFFLYFMYHWEKKYENKWYRNVGPFCLIISGCITSIGIRASLLAFNNYEALMTNPKMLNDPHLNDERQDALYVKPYTRISPYLIGLFLGYVLSREVSIISGKQKVLKILIWFFSFLIGMSLVYGPYISAYKTKGDHFGLIENVVYGSVAAFVWSIIICWVIYACHNGLGGYINSILSWPIWMPLSRLTFGAYLLHPIVIFYANWVRETPYHYQDNLIVFDITSITVLSYGAAFILSVGVEFPIANLEKLIFKL